MVVSLSPKIATKATNSLEFVSDLTLTERKQKQSDGEIVLDFKFQMCVTKTKELKDMLLLYFHAEHRCHSDVIQQHFNPIFMQLFSEL